jgi:protein TonB
MTKSFILLLLLIGCQAAAPTARMPEPIGGLNTLYGRVDYPESARMARIQGTVVIQLTVSERGVPSDIKVLEGIGGGCDEAAVRAVRSSRFTPARNASGTAVSSTMIIPIIFRVQ